MKCIFLIFTLFPFVNVHAKEKELMAIVGNVFLYNRHCDEIHIDEVYYKLFSTQKQAQEIAKSFVKFERETDSKFSYRDSCNQRIVKCHFQKILPNGKFEISAWPGTFLLLVESGNYHTRIVKIKKGKTEYKNIGIETTWVSDTGDDDSLSFQIEQVKSKFVYDGMYPRFPGERNAFSNYMCNNLHYPEDVLEKELEGSVEVSFGVDADGTVKNMKCDKSTGATFEKEVIRCLERMPQWQQAKKQVANQNIKVDFCLMEAAESEMLLMKYNADEQGKETHSDSLHIIVKARRLPKILSQSEGGLTFVVDENLESIKDPIRYCHNANNIVELILEDADVMFDLWEKPDNIVAMSFDGDENMAYMGKDAFFQSVINAYAYHQSISFSPDMIWLLICQGFSRYVNEHSEEMRYRLVSHSGKKKLTVSTNRNLLKDKRAWPELVKKFSELIDEHTKGGVAELIASDFSTTGPVESVASRITLMESMKQYFSYHASFSVCGIPSIRLTGTPDDWRDVLKRTERLKSYGLEGWLNSLEPILKEFVAASEGKPDQRFWQSIVRKERVGKLVNGSCSRPNPTKFDGWILKFFPYADGRIPESVSYGSKMPTGMLNVDMIYSIESPYKKVQQYNLELWAGFIGAQKDVDGIFIVPKIGWFVRHSTKNE
jgi:TonB family protein